MYVYEDEILHAATVHLLLLLYNCCRLFCCVPLEFIILRMLPEVLFPPR